jgi:hypothetical protein
VSDRGFIIQKRKRDMAGEEQAGELDRQGFAISLRELGLAYTDFEDWDGLTDEEAVRLTSYMNNFEIDPELVRMHTHEV